MLKLTGKAPGSAVFLGIAGALPFVASVVMLLFVENPAVKPVLALQVYAAVILSFLGGVRWGFAIHDKAVLSLESQSRQLLISVLPSIVAWLAMLVPEIPSLIILALGFSALLAVDLSSGRSGFFPAWYAQLRIPLSVAAVSTLLVGMLVLLGN